MIGNKKLSTIREELRAVFAEEGANPIAALDRRIRNLKKSSIRKKSRSLVLLRNALAQLVEDKPRKRQRSARTKRTKKAM